MDRIGQPQFTKEITKCRGRWKLDEVPKYNLIKCRQIHTRNVWIQNWR